MPNYINFLLNLTEFRKVGRKNHENLEKFNQKTDKNLFKFAKNLAKFPQNQHGKIGFGPADWPMLFLECAHFVDEVVGIGHALQQMSELALRHRLAGVPVVERVRIVAVERLRRFLDDLCDSENFKP